jgi:short-subunit dehydrogenase
MSDLGALVVLGAGPGVGASVARRFGRAGHPVGLVARNAERLAGQAAELSATGVVTATATADVTRPDQVAAALAALTEQLGWVQVLCISPLPDIGLIKPVTATTPADLGTALALNLVGPAAAVQAVLPAMQARRQGTVLATTGSAALEPSAERATSGVAYAAETAYLRMLHDALRPDGVHVGQVVVRGAVGPGLRHEPDAVADALWCHHVERAEPLTVLG